MKEQERLEALKQRIQQGAVSEQFPSNTGRVQIGFNHEKVTITIRTEEETVEVRMEIRDAEMIANNLAEAIRYIRARYPHLP